MKFNVLLLISLLFLFSGCAAAGAGIGVVQVEISNNVTVVTALVNNTLTFDNGGSLTDNGTCAFIISPNGSDQIQVCDGASIHFVSEGVNTYIINRTLNQFLVDTNVNGTMTANSFIGDGSGLSNLSGGSTPFGLGTWGYESFTFEPPGPGAFRLNSTVVENASILWLSEFSIDGVNKGNLLGSVIDVGTELYFQQTNDRNNFFNTVVTSITDDGLYLEFNITSTEVTGTITPGVPFILYAIGNGGGGAIAFNGLTDVNVPSPSDGDVVFFDSGTSKWINTNKIQIEGQGVRLEDSTNQLKITDSDDSKTWIIKVESGDLIINDPTGSGNIIKFRTDNGKMGFDAIGTFVNEFSNDGTLAGNSNDALTTEQAVKTYADISRQYVRSVNSETATNLNILEVSDFDVNVPITGTTTISGDFTAVTDGIKLDFNGVIFVTSIVHMTAGAGRVNVQTRLKINNVSQGAIGNSYVRVNGGVDQSSAINGDIITVSSGDILSVGARREPGQTVAASTTMAQNGTSSLLIMRMS